MHPSCEMVLSVSDMCGSSVPAPDSLPGYPITPSTVLEVEQRLPDDTCSTFLTLISGPDDPNKAVRPPNPQPLGHLRG